MRKGLATFLGWLNRQAWYRVKRLAALKTSTVPKDRQHRPWTMSKARENSRRRAQFERLAAKRARKGG